MKRVNAANRLRRIITNIIRSLNCACASFPRHASFVINSLLLTTGHRIFMLMLFIQAFSRAAVFEGVRMYYDVFVLFFKVT